MKMNKKTVVIYVMIAILFAGTIFYYNWVANDRNSQIASLNTQITNHNNEIANQKNEISNLTAQVLSLKGQAAKLSYLTSANLVTTLGITEVPGSSSSYMGGLVPTPVRFNYLFIEGSVTNTGKGTAYNAGLHVVAYSANGTLEINMTVPLVEGASFGSDKATDAYLNVSSSPTLGALYSEHTADVYVNIFHEGTVSTWTVTPVWTNSKLP
jgi:uncharacterized protein YxeA